MGEGLQGLGQRPHDGRGTILVLSQENQLSRKERARQDFAFLSFGMNPVPQDWTRSVGVPHGAGVSFLRWPRWMATP